MYVVIAGINTLSRRLVKRLEGNHDVVVMDGDEDRCERLYSSSGATVINKNPTTITALEDAGITQADALISTMKDDNQNMVVCSLGKKYGVPKVVSRLDDEEYFDAFEIIGADTIGHNDILLSEFLSAIEHPYLVKLANLSGGRELLKASVEKESRLRDSTADEVRQMRGFPESFELISVLQNGDQQSELTGVKLEKDAELILIGPEEDKQQLDEFFKKQ